jgi:hypothetical protein
MSPHEGRLSRAVVESLTLDTEPWLSCEECFELMDSYAEAVVTGAEPRRRHDIEVHLRACPACFEEVESLVALLREDAGD